MKNKHNPTLIEMLIRALAISISIVFVVFAIGFIIAGNRIKISIIDIKDEANKLTSSAEQVKQLEEELEKSYNLIAEYKSSAINQSEQNIQVRALPEHFTRPLGLSRGTAEAREIDNREWEKNVTVIKNSDILNVLDQAFGTEENRVLIKQRLDNEEMFFEIEPRLAFISEEEFAEMYNEGTLLKRIFYLVGDENKPQISYLTDYFEVKLRLSKIGNEQSDYTKLMVKTGLPPMGSHRRSAPYTGELYFLFDTSEIRLHTPHGLFEVI